jgi:hypothetical protein
LQLSVERSWLQLVGRTSNPKVGGSNPLRPIKKCLQIARLSIRALCIDLPWMYKFRQPGDELGIERVLGSTGWFAAGDIGWRSGLSHTSPTSITT